MSTATLPTSSPGGAGASQPLRPIRRTFVRRAATWSIVAQVAFTLSWLVAAVFQGRYGHMDQTISELAASTAEQPWILITGFLVYGTGFAALSSALYASVGGGKRARGGAVALLVAAAMMPLVAFNRLDCITSSAACRAAVEAEQVSGHHDLHNLASLVLFLAVVVAPLAFAHRFKHDARWADLRMPSIVAGWLSLVMLVVNIGWDGHDHGSGLVQRLFVAVPTIWMVVVALRARRLAR